MKKLKNFYIIIIIFFSTLNFAQRLENDYCGFNEVNKNIRIDSDFESFFNQKISQELNTIHFSKNNTVFTIPVVFHIFNEGEAIGVGTNISDQIIFDALQKLNDDFQNANNYSSSINTNIKFVLATKSNNGNCERGIQRINMSNNSVYMNYGLSYNGAPGVSNTTLKGISEWNPAQYFNIYIVNNINSSSGVVLGFATRPYMLQPNPNAIIAIVSENVGKNYGTISHETGHWFDLLHTFEGANGNTCPPPISNGCGYGLGDCISDTPPHTLAFTSDNNISEFNPCVGDNNSIFKTNVMNYNLAYMNDFTPQQSLRMRSAIEYYLSFYLNSSNYINNIDITPTADFLINGLSGTNFICTNQNFRLINTSKCFLNTFQQNSQSVGQTSLWTIKKNGLTILTSNLTNPEISLSQPGVYSISLTVSNNNGSNTINRDNILFIQDLSSTNNMYCQPTFNRPIGSNANATIYKVNLANISKRSSSFIVDNYLNNSCEIAILNSQQVNSLTLDFGVSTSPFYYKVFIDYNMNGIFDSNEMIGQGNAVSVNNSGVSTKVINFTMLVGTPLNTPYRMRIIADLMNVNDSKANCNENIFWGEVEDYTVVFVNQNILATSEVAEKSSFTIYPNPATTTLNIISGQENIKNLEVFDMSGRKVLEKRNLNAVSYKLDVSTLIPGVYHIKINESFSNKIIKN